MGKTKKLPKHEEAFKVLLRYEKETDLSKLAEGVNRIAAIHESLKSEMEQKCGHKDFTEVKGLDFNVYYHDQIYGIKELYFELYGVYCGCKFDQKGFSVLDINKE